MPKKWGLHKCYATGLNSKLNLLMLLKHRSSCGRGPDKSRICWWCFSWILLEEYCQCCYNIRPVVVLKVKYEE